MKIRKWKVGIGLVLGMVMSGLLNWLAYVPVVAQPLSDLLPKEAIAPTQINNLKEMGTNLDGFIPNKLQEVESPIGQDRAVIGEDQRLPMLSREYPWSTVGKIVMIGELGKEYSCTGTLISKSLVLTNAHCVYEKNKFFGRIFFLPNLINGRLRTRADVAIVKNIFTGTKNPALESEDDWAILELDKPLGNKYGFLKWRSVPLAVLKNAKNKISVAGYSGDYPDPKVYRNLTTGKGNTAGVHWQCSILGETDGMLVHDCDTNSGASGSALISKIDGAYHIVGLHAAGRKDRRGRGIENYAVRISRIEAALSKGSR